MGDTYNAEMAQAMADHEIARQMAQAKQRLEDAKNSVKVAQDNVDALFKKIESDNVLGLQRTGVSPIQDGEGKKSAKKPAAKKPSSKKPSSKKPSSKKPAAKKPAAKKPASKKPAAKK